MVMDLGDKTVYIMLVKGDIVQSPRNCIDYRTLHDTVLHCLSRQVLTQTIKADTIIQFIEEGDVAEDDGPVFLTDRGWEGSLILPDTLTL